MFEEVAQRLRLKKKQLLFLVEQRFKIGDIAVMFACSRRTIERRLTNYGINSHNFSLLSDVELDEHVRQICSLNPLIGEKTVSGRLRHQGVYVQRERIRASLRRVDPAGVSARVKVYYADVNIQFPHPMICGT